MSASPYEESLLDTLKKYPGLMIGTVVTLLVVVLLITSWFIFGRTETVTQADFIRDHNPVVSGPEDAEIKMVYLYDLECPACRSFNSILEEIIADDQKDYQVVYKNFPLENIHPQAKPAAYGALAVYEQKPELFKEYVDLIYARQDQISNNTIEQIARELDIDYDQWNEARNSKALRDKVQQDLDDIRNVTFPAEREGSEIKPYSTPTVVLYKGDEVKMWWAGGAPVEEIEARIEEIKNS